MIEAIILTVVNECKFHHEDAERAVVIEDCIILPRHSGKHNDDIEKLASQTTDTSSVLSRAQTFVTTLTLVLILTSSTPFVKNANEGFGPSSGATTSPPPNLITPRIDNGDLMGNQQNKKLKQLIGFSLDENRLGQFKLQLDDLTETIKH
eukprot:scaffold18488_cov59-Cyclotella_meneghiniana.AAC.1